MAGGEAGFHEEKHTRQKAAAKNRKLDSQVQPHQPPIGCPECTSQRVWKDGLRKTGLGIMQRYLCRDCGFRFSLSSQLKVEVYVPRKSLELLDPGPNLAEKVIRDGDLAPQKLVDGLSFPDREDLGSHSRSKPALTT